MFTFTIKAFFESEKKAVASFGAISPELNQRHERRSKTTMSIEGKNLVLGVDAFDKKSLKASINSYLRLLGLSISASEVL